MASKAELLDYLDKHVFHRIMNASERDLGTKQRESLEDLKKRTEVEKARFHGYDSAARSWKCTRTISIRKRPSRSTHGSRILVCRA